MLCYRQDVRGVIGNCLILTGSPCLRLRKLGQHPFRFSRVRATTLAGRVRNEVDGTTLDLDGERFCVRASVKDMTFEGLTAPKK